MLEKNILVLANNPLSDMGSNGRTFKNFFSLEDRERLAQIYIFGEAPAFDVCSRFFRVGDGEVLRACLHRTDAGHEIREADAPLSVTAGSKRKVRKSPFTMLVRDFFWNRRVWRKRVNAWIDAFSPDAVVLQAGDSPFMYRWAVEIARERGIPLAIYNSEDYYFKKYDFMRSRGVSHLLYPFYHRRLRRAVREALAYATISVYISEDLKRTYDVEFEKPSEYIYTATSVLPNKDNVKEGVFSYLGNLGINRHKGLIKIAEALSRIDSSYRLDVYGKLPNKEVGEAFAACEAIRYRGLVDYATVCRVMGESTLLFHTESFEEFYRRDIRHGFSTKIADSLASGSCFVIFAPPELSCTKYLKANACACVIDCEDELEAKLREVIGNRELRRTLVERAIAVAIHNHDAETNRARMASILNEL